MPPTGTVMHRERRCGRSCAGALWLGAGLLLLAAAACSPEHAAMARQTPDKDGNGVAIRDRGPAAGAGGADTVTAWTMPDVPASIAEGIRVYRANYCGTCHHNSLAGTAGIFGPTHDGLRATAEKRIHDPGYTGRATTAEGYVRESIREPGAYRAPGFEHTRFLMPAYIQLTDTEVDALVRMLLWQPPVEGGR